MLQPDYMFLSCDYLLLSHCLFS